MAATRSQAGQKRPSQGADTRDSFSPNSAEGQPEEESEPVCKKARLDLPTTTNGSEPPVPPAGQEGWNGSVGAGLRTSFGGSAKLQKYQVGSQEDKAPGSAASPRTKPASDGEAMIVDGWTIPKGLLAEKLKKRPILRNGDSWESRLCEWYAALVEHNQDKEGLEEPAVVLPIWGQWLERQDEMPQPLRAKCLKLTVADPVGAKTLRKQIKQLQIGGNNADKKEDSQPNAPHYGWTLPPPIDSANFQLPMKEDGPWVERFASWLYEFGKLNNNLPPMDKGMEFRLAGVYHEWIATLKLSRNKTNLASKLALQAFFTQRERLSKILGGEWPSGGAPHPNEVIVLSSSSEGEVSEGDQRNTPVVATNGNRPSPAENTALNEDVVMNVNPDRLAGQVLYNWNRVSRLPSVKTQEKPINPSLPAIPASTKPIKLMSGEEELEYRAAYYPGVLPDEIFCLNCINHGHITSKCPLLTCRWCGDWGHLYTRCPTRHRCAKCRQIGHEAGTCTEKLALPWDQLDCARCGAKNHLENACYEVFRSTFNPPPSRTHKVKDLPIYCGTCGSQGHYWTECGLNAGWVTDAEKDGLTSAVVRKCYVDPSCDNVAICYSAATGYQIRGAAAAEGRPPQLNGKSIVPQRHVEYFEEDDDDDDDVQFIRPPPQKPRAQQSGKITFASFSSSNNGGGGRGGGNRGRGGGGGQSRGGGQRNGGHGGRANPPLPPGPPQSTSRSGQGSRPRHGKRGGRGGRGGH